MAPKTTPTNIADGRDLPGTTYLAPSGVTYRLTRFEIPFGLIEDGVTQPHPDMEVPVYDVWTVRGGSAGAVSELPAGCVRVVIPIPERPPVGSLFVAADGTAYRLRDYSTDWDAVPFTGEKTIPTYTAMLVGGSMTNTGVLPADARLVWTPAPSA